VVSEGQTAGRRHVVNNECQLKNGEGDMAGGYGMGTVVTVTGSMNRPRMIILDIEIPWTFFTIHFNNVTKGTISM
jgi:hypothetical protein